MGNINIDRTPPVISVQAFPPANEHGWRKSNVFLDFTASDALSGLVSATPDQYLKGEGADLSMTGTAQDKAGNTAEVTATGINVDLTRPEIAGSVSPSPNVNGWNNTDVTVSFQCTDPLSGILSCSDPVLLTAQAQNLWAAGEAFDKAGNTRSVTVSGINIDKTPPTVYGAATVPSNTLGWYNQNITVNFTALDQLSGLQGPVPSQLISTEGANLEATGVARDRAGNEGSFTVRPLNLDKTPPTISAAQSPAANSYGWNNSDVTVNFICADSLSDILSCSHPVVLTQHGGIQSASGSASDRAGNTASTTLSGINIDKIPPAVTLTGPTLLLEGAFAEVTALATDSLSGLGVDPSGKYSLDTSTAGWHTISVSATDKAGNSASASLTYMVWGVEGPYAPLATRGAQDAQFKAGASIPVRFELNDGTNVVGSATGTVSIGSNSSEFRWSEGSKQYMATLPTPSTPGTRPMILSVAGAGSTVISSVTLR